MGMFELSSDRCTLGMYRCWDSSDIWVCVNYVLCKLTLTWFHHQGMLQLVSHCCTERQIPVCPYCHRVFHNASSDLRRHIWIHEGIKPFECHMCHYACRTRSNLAAHMLRHSADKPFLCNSCGKAYKSRTALRWHERSHVSGRMFKCDKYVLIFDTLVLIFWIKYHVNIN